jgi:hypothetical protein
LTALIALKTGFIPHYTLNNIFIGSKAEDLVVSSTIENTPSSSHRLAAPGRERRNPAPVVVLQRRVWGATGGAEGGSGVAVVLRCLHGSEQEHQSIIHFRTAR